MKKLKIKKTIADRVIVIPFEQEKVTEGGIIIPDTVKERPTMGKVVYVGPGYANEPMDIEVGDIVPFGQYAGTEMEIDGVKYIFLRRGDCFCTLSEE